MGMKTNITVQLTASQLRQAAELADNIEKQQAQLTALLTGQPISFKGGHKSIQTATGRKLSPASRKAISEGLRNKWAARKAGLTTAPASVVPSTPAVAKA